MRKQNPIDSLLSSAKKEILSATYGQPDKWWYLSELAERAGKTPSSLQRELSIFTGNGLLTSRRDGNRVYYRAAKDTAIFHPLKDLLDLTVGWETAVRLELENLRSQIKTAFIYGSAAKNEDRVDSDIDIMIVGSVKMLDLIRAIKPIEQKYNKEINFRCYSSEEFGAKLKTKNHFVLNVMREPKRFLIGDEDDLRRLGS